MNSEKSIRRYTDDIKGNRICIALISATTIATILVSLYCYYSGSFIMLQNLFYVQEAQVMSAADVVEAVASLRPYRPAPGGIPAALRKMEKNKGILYDARVVDVRLGLFREKGFRFE